MTDRQRAIVPAPNNALAERSLRPNPRMTRGLVRTESLLEEQHVGQVLRVHDGPWHFSMSPGKFSLDSKYFLRQVTKRGVDYSTDDWIRGRLPSMFQLCDGFGEILTGWDGYPSVDDGDLIRNYRPLWNRFCPVPDGWMLLAYCVHQCDEYDPDYDDGPDIHAMRFSSDFSHYWDLGHVSGQSYRRLASICTYDDGMVVFGDHVYHLFTPSGLRATDWSDLRTVAECHVQSKPSIIAYDYPNLVECAFEDGELHFTRAFEMRIRPFSLAVHGDLLVARMKWRISKDTFANRIAAIRDGQIIGAFEPDISGLTPAHDGIRLEPRDISCDGDTIILSVENSNEGFVSYRGGEAADWEALPILDGAAPWMPYANLLTTEMEEDI